MAPKGESGKGPLRRNSCRLAGRHMSDFDFTDSRARAIRSCQTHAMAAELFSRTVSTGDAAVWNDIARHWAELADLKRRMAADSHPQQRHTGQSSAPKIGPQGRR